MALWWGFQYEFTCCQSKVPYRVWVTEAASYCSVSQTDHSVSLKHFLFSCLWKKFLMVHSLFNSMLWENVMKNSYKSFSFRVCYNLSGALTYITNDVIKANSVLHMLFFANQQNGEKLIRLLLCAKNKTVYL